MTTPGDGRKRSVVVRRTALSWTRGREEKLAVLTVQADDDAARSRVNAGFQETSWIF